MARSKKEDLTTRARRARLKELEKAVAKGNVSRDELSEIEEIEGALACTSSPSEFVSSKAKLAKALDRAERTIGSWLGQGAPAKVKGRGYDLDAWRRWVAERENSAGDQAEFRSGASNEAEDLNPSAKDRREIARARLEELELERELGNVIARDEAIAQWAQIVSDIKTGLYLMTRRLPGLLEGIPAAEIEKRLRREIDHICRHFSAETATGGDEAGPAA